MMLVTGVNAMEEIALVSAVGHELGDRDLHVKHPVVLDSLRWPECCKIWYVDDVRTVSCWTCRW
jgi:hypothetical protein